MIAKGTDYSNYTVDIPYYMDGTDKKFCVKLDALNINESYQIGFWNRKTGEHLHVEPLAQKASCSLKGWENYTPNGQWKHDGNDVYDL